ncbi:porin [Limimaricola sp.]|uniref:porin n=1 Tax=Limimaricola sp. TaxID=2211665 RepID=UPI0040588B9F
MKRILLASASIVAFAGAAAAEVTFNGEAALGYNDTEAESDGTTGGDEDRGFYWDAELGITLSQELDNGLTAAATVTSDLVDDSLEGDIFAEGYVLSLTSETAGLFFGDTDMAANLRWDGVSEMAHDGFSETDGETVLRGDFMAYGFDASVSALVDDVRDDDNGTGDSLDQFSVGIAGTFGAFEMSAAYQEEERDFDRAADIDNGDYNPNQIFGIAFGTAFAGADIDVAYAREEDEAGDSESSTGIEAAYPLGPVTLGAFYVHESDDDGDSFGVAADYVSGPLTISTAYEEVREGDEDWAIEAGYDFGMGLNFYAGVSDAGEDAYAAATYDLAEGAQLLVSYGHDDDNDSEDEIGDPEYQEGTTVEVSFEF